MRAQRRNTSIFFLACCLLLLLLFAPADASDDSSRPQSPHLRHRRAAEKSTGDGDASSYLDTQMKLVWHDASRFVPMVSNPSPDKTTVVSAGGDETLRFWNCFSSDNKQKKKQRAFAASRSQLYTGIR